LAGDGGWSQVRNAGHMFYFIMGERFKTDVVDCSDYPPVLMKIEKFKERIRVVSVRPHLEPGVQGPEQKPMKRQIKIRDGIDNTIGSSQMEHLATAEFLHLLAESQGEVFVQLRSPDISVIFVVDGDLSNQTLLSAHAHISVVVDDLYHLCKRAIKKFATSAFVKLKRFLPACVRWLKYLVNHNRASLDETATRQRWLDTARHFSGDHTQCDASSKCHQVDFNPTWRQLETTELKAFVGILHRIWPSNVNLLAFASGSSCEGVMRLNTFFMQKNMAYLTSGGMRSSMTTMQRDLGDVGRAQTARVATGLKPLSEDEAKQIELRVHKKEGGKSRQRNHRKKYQSTCAPVVEYGAFVAEAYYDDASDSELEEPSENLVATVYICPLVSLGLCERKKPYANLRNLKKHCQGKHPDEVKSEMPGLEFAIDHSTYKHACDRSGDEGVSSAEEDDKREDLMQCELHPHNCAHTSGKWKTEEGLKNHYTTKHPEELKQGVISLPDIGLADALHLMTSFPTFEDWFSGQVIVVAPEQPLVGMDTVLPATSVDDNNTQPQAPADVSPQPGGKKRKATAAATCRCGSLTHSRVSHKDCALNTQRKRL
jgi:hypothetical protein